MTLANTPRRDGDVFQARQFWLRALHLLDDQSPIVRVGFESGPKSFDDVWVEYDPARAPKDHYGNALVREHVQCKWHASPGSYGFRDLVEPEFVNANTRSLLERALSAKESYASSGDGVRFKLVSNWRIDRADPLREIIGNRSGGIRMDRFSAGLTPRSKTGGLRKLWGEHLSLDAPELAALAQTLAFGEATDSLDDVRAQVDLLLRLSGLRRIPVSHLSFDYDQIIFEWMNQGCLEYDKNAFFRACTENGLFEAAGATSVPTFGVKSFEHPIDRLEDRCVRVLDFVPKFDDRFIRSGEEWNTALYPALRAFLIDAAKIHERPRLALDAHTTLAFAAGSVLDLKSGRICELEQRALKREVWSADEDAPPGWASWDSEIIDISTDASEVAVAISVTHNVADDVSAFVARALPEVGRIISLRINGDSVGPKAVENGRHAFELAVQVVSTLRSLSKRATRFHLFIAAPNGFSFYLGQHHGLLQSMTLYEFDFEGRKSGSYAPSLSLPLS